MEKVVEETASILNICVPQQHKDKVYDLLLPLAKGTLQVDKIMIKGAALPTWDTWNLKCLGLAW